MYEFFCFDIGIKSKVDSFIPCRAMAHSAKSQLWTKFFLCVCKMQTNWMHVICWRKCHKPWWGSKIWNLYFVWVIDPETWPIDMIQVIYQFEAQFCLFCFWLDLLHVIRFVKSDKTSRLTFISLSVISWNDFLSVVKYPAVVHSFSCSWLKAIGVGLSEIFCQIHYKVSFVHHPKRGQFLSKPEYDCASLVVHDSQVLLFSHWGHSAVRHVKGIKLLV